MFRTHFIKNQICEICIKFYLEFVYVSHDLKHVQYAQKQAISERFILKLKNRSDYYLTYACHLLLYICRKPL